ncbi:MAG: 8-amino-7-oxononanoate synthase [Planctomycetota bacterium]|nr:8-amino-7-oxononanoate synthase [Planctomycetota bacterium]
MNLWQEMGAALSDLESADLLRRPVTLDSPPGPVVSVGGRALVCLCGNDYLCLAGDPTVKAAALAAVAEWGVGAGASRLICGTSALHVALETRLAGFKGTEAAVVTSTGWMANRAAIFALAGPGDLILCDKLDHASILDAAADGGAVFRTFVHRDVARAARLLDKLRPKARRCLLVTDTVFSMDGDLAPLGELVALKNRYDAQLLIDEAHATGVLGEHGRGAAELLGVESGIDAVVGTLSKALGSLGGFIAGPGVLIDTIRNTGRPYIYTTALPPALCAAALASLDIVRDEPGRRLRLGELSLRLRTRLHALGVSTGDSATQIIPIPMGSPARAVAVSRELFEAGYLIPAIRPPTVAPQSSRLRVSLTSGHTEEQLDALADLLGPLAPAGHSF